MTQKYEIHRLDEDELREFYIKEQENTKRSALLGFLGAGIFAIGSLAGAISAYVSKFHYGWIVAGVVVAGFSIWGFIRNLHWYKDAIEDIMVNQPTKKIKQGPME